MPNGFAWDLVREDGMFAAAAKEFCRVDDRIKDFLNEIDPGNAVELLTDWEDLLGLPDECSPPGQSVEERQITARAKLGESGGSSASFFEEIADALGFPDTTVENTLPFHVGRARVGDRLTNNYDIRFRVGEMRVGDRLARYGWDFCFQVTTDASNVEPFKVGSSVVGEPLVNFGNTLLNCTILKRKRASTCVFFTFN